MDDLRRLGVFETRSHDKFIPEPYLSANRADRIDLLRGLMDSDGWAETFGAIRFGTASERLANDVCYLIRSIGGVCSIRARSTTYTYKGERKQGRTSYTCRIRLKNPAEVFTLDRKIERVGRIKNTLRLNFTSIEPARFDQVQCISVSHPQRLYVTDDFIITHNTAVAVSYALGSAQNGHGVLFATLEMSSRELAGRMAADMCYRDGRGIPYGAIRKGSLDEWQRKQVTRAGQHMCTLPFQVVEKGNLTTGRLNMLIRRHKRRMEAKGQKLELVVVDYLQLMRPDRRGSKYEDVSEVSMALKAMAMDHGVAIMALAQLSRLVEQRPDKRPQLSDLRDSGQIEQDADVVLFLLREEYYLRLTEPDESDPKRAGWEASMDTARNRIEFIVAKRRNGETGTAIGQFHGAFQAVRGS
jgi:replicative DNA helicase